jgi:prefoldin subunit 5
VNKTQTRIVDAALKALGKCPDFESEIDNLTELCDELQEEFDGLGEKAQSNDNGQALEAAISNLDEAIEAIQAIVEKVEEAAAALDEASAS